MNRTEFNLQKALKGAELVTRDGRKAVNFRKRSNISDRFDYPYVALIDGGESTFTPEGRSWTKEEHINDLFLAENITPDQVKQYVLAHRDEVKKWLNPPIMTTHDGVDIVEEKQKLYCIIKERHNTLCEPYAVNVARREGKYISFSTPQARHSYMVMNMPLLSVNELLSIMPIHPHMTDNLISLATSKLAK